MTGSWRPAMSRAWWRECPPGLLPSIWPRIQSRSWWSCMACAAGPSALSGLCAATGSPSRNPLVPLVRFHGISRRRAHASPGRGRSRRAGECPPREGSRTSQGELANGLGTEAGDLDDRRRRDGHRAGSLHASLAQSASPGGQRGRVPADRCARRGRRPGPVPRSRPPRGRADRPCRCARRRRRSRLFLAGRLDDATRDRRLPARPGRRDNAEPGLVRLADDPRSRDLGPAGDGLADQGLDRPEPGTARSRLG